jgi:hypothetical protein
VDKLRPQLIRLEPLHKSAVKFAQFKE